MKVKNYSLFVLLICGILFQSNGYAQSDSEYSYTIPTEGNSWTVNGIEETKEIVKKGGIKNWTEYDIRIRTYFKTTGKGMLNVGLVANAVDGFARIKVSCNGKSELVEIKNEDKEIIPIGNFLMEKAGYNYIELEGIKKDGDFFSEISGLAIGGEACEEQVYFVNEDFYWGRRGPSVHLNYQVPETAGDVVYYYNEITVPEGNDVLGSYFMANGFAQGYFGMQVNSPTERRILFSVWSPFKTDNPRDIPNDQKIKMLKKGEGVYTGEFGNEGSGGQSYYKYSWKAGNTYQFLLKGVPAGNDATDFTAWFFAPEKKEWKLIASFRRPKTNSYLTRFHSFLENFYTETGNQSRKVLYSNQWVYSTKGEWTEITKMRFTADATARKESRMDYSGGAEGKFFFLKNCGFFSETTTIDSTFERKASGVSPQINFDELP